MNFAFMLTLIESVITFTLMKQVIDGILNMKNPVMKWKMIKLLGHPAVSFAVNLAISVLLTQFTGGGLNAGFANLTSSVIVAIAVPIYVRFRTAGTSEEQELEALQRKEEYEERKKRREKEKKEKDKNIRRVV